MKKRVIMAAIPRSGSTWFCRSLAGKPQNDNCMWGQGDPDIVKTHFPAPPVPLPKNWCTVFMFGDPAASVASTIKNRNDETHYWNCACSIPPGWSVDLRTRDWLGYERMFDSWTSFLGTLCLRYETAHEHAREVREHTGWDFDFLPVRQRKGRAWLKDVSMIEKAYDSLCCKIQAAPDCWIVQPAS